MRRIHETDIEAVRVRGSAGHVDVWDALSEPIVAGVREVAPHSDVPPRPHRHPEAQLIYVIEGEPVLSTGTDSIRLRPGDFVLLEPEEEHYILTDDAPARLFEIRYPL